MSSEKKKKWLLVDGHNLAFRCFYGVPKMTRTDGMHINAIFGYTRTLLKLEETYEPSAMCIFFDTDGSSLRKEILSTYKANRKKMPQELIEQIDWMRTLAISMGYFVNEHIGVEADDLIWSFAKKISDEGEEAYIVSADKDFAQCILDNIFQLLPPLTNSKSSNWRLLDKRGILEKYGLRVDQMIDYLALMGDASDNIGGLPGVGPKTAVKWLTEFGSIKNICDNTTKVRPERFQKILLEYKDILSRNQRLIRLQEVADFKVPLAEIKPDLQELERQLSELELHSILRDIRKKNQGTLFQ